MLKRDVTKFTELEWKVLEHLSKMFPRKFENYGHGMTRVDSVEIGIGCFPTELGDKGMKIAFEFVVEAGLYDPKDPWPKKLKDGLAAIKK